MPASSSCCASRSRCCTRCIITFFFDGNEPLPTFEQALAAETDRSGGRRLCRQTYFAQGLAYRRVVRYTEQVRRYFEVFGRERVHVIIYDDFAADVSAAYRQTLDFLGLECKDGNPWDGRCFPSYARIAEAAGCVERTVGNCLPDLEAAGLLTWVNRIQRVRERVAGLGGIWASTWRVIRTSNAYDFPLIAKQQPTIPDKGKNHLGTSNQVTSSLNSPPCPTEEPANPDFLAALESWKPAFSRTGAESG